MKHTFKEDGNWILPKEGTLGNKAKNLYDNRRAIERWGLKIPRSLVIPYEYMDDEGFIFNVLDWIEQFFPGKLEVAVRSNAPDEDLGARNPGAYKSMNICLSDRLLAGKDIGRILCSYNTEVARARRKQTGLEEKAMCLLVQEYISHDCFTGVFSDIGDLARLTFVNPNYGMNAMQSPKLHEYFVDEKGKIVRKGHDTGDSYIAGRMRGLVRNLPQLPENKGWEIEFLKQMGSNDIYVVQTTPIEKSPRFSVQHTEDSIFASAEVYGTGIKVAEGILWVPWVDEEDYEVVREFDRTHRDYCLATTHLLLTTARRNGKDEEAHLLSFMQNPILVVDNSKIGGLKSLSAHIEQYLREGRIALRGIFAKPWADIMPPGDNLCTGMDTTIRYSPTKLEVQADEIDQKANLVVAGEMNPFVCLEDLENKNGITE